MSNFLNKFTKLINGKAKIIILGYGVLLAIVLLFSLFYSTPCKDIHVYYSKDSSGKISINYTDTHPISNNNQKSLFQYFSYSNVDTLDGVQKGSNPEGMLLAPGSILNEPTDNFKEFGYADTVYNFQHKLSDFNTQLVVFVLVSLVLLAIMLICSNSSRKVYYISNLVSGVAAPAVVIIYTIVMMVINCQLLGTFNKNTNLFKTVAAMQKSGIDPLERDYKLPVDSELLLSKVTDVNNSAFIIINILFVFVILYSLCLIAYTVYRYISCSAKRKEIIERAVAHDAK